MAATAVHYGGDILSPPATKLSCRRETRPGLFCCRIGHQAEIAIPVRPPGGVQCVSAQWEPTRTELSKGLAAIRIYRRLCLGCHEHTHGLFAGDPHMMVCPRVYL